MKLLNNSRHYKKAINALNSTEIANQEVANEIAFLKNSTCEKTNIKVYTQKEKADIINTFYAEGIKNVNNFENTALDNFCQMLSNELGVKKPDIITKTSADIFVNGEASEKNTITLYASPLSPKNSKFMGHTFAQIISTLVHENSHITQYANIKNYLNGIDDIEAKYKVMAHFYIFERCRKDKLYYVISALNPNTYYYSPLELDARISASKYLLDLLENTYIYNEIKADIKRFLLCKTQEDINIANAVNRFNKLYTSHKNHFIKNYSETKVGIEILEKLGTTQKDFASFKNQLSVCQKNFYPTLWTSTHNQDKTKLSDKQK